MALGGSGALEADARLRVLDAQWSVDGHLTSRRVTVEADGRRAAARPRRASLRLPAPDGGGVCAVICSGFRNKSPHKREEVCVVSAVRTLVVWCHDWPVVAAGFSPDDPVAVVFANRVTATSAAARAEGVATGLRRREAQARCPGLVVLEPDPARDARAFEPIVAALEALTPRIEITFPGSCAFATRGPSRYFGGDEALAVRATDLAAAVLAGRGECHVGIADGPFAARLAAQASGGVIVPPGESPAFLAPFPVDVLDQFELSDVLVRLGLRTLGDFAAMPAPAVVGRFGADGSRAHRLARGLDERPPAARVPPPDLAVSAELDPPAERVDTAAFVAKSLADELHRRLAADGLACTRILVAAETEHGERLERLWRDEGALTPGAIADRTRWQLDGWLNGHHRPTAGITLLRLAPDEVVPARGRQLGFWGGVAEAGERAARALARVEGLLGPGAVTVAERRGGRGPGDQIALVPVSAVDLASPRPVGPRRLGGRTLAGPAAPTRAGTGARRARARPVARRHRRPGGRHRPGRAHRRTGGVAGARGRAGGRRGVGRAVAGGRTLVGPGRPSPPGSPPSRHRRRHRPPRNPRSGCVVGRGNL